MRNAKNESGFEAIYQTTGISVEVISGMEEARLIALGFANERASDPHAL